MMLEPSLKRTHKLQLFFVVGLLAFMGFFVASKAVLADTASQGGDKSQWDFTPGPTEASTTTNTGNTGSQTPADQGSTASCGYLNWVFNIGTCVVVPIIDGARSAMAWFASGAAGLFVWVVDPANMSGPTGILNKGSIYELWKFIRDFFNLFFILILLLSAFATVFQVENFSIRKIFLNILIAALVINFSFPITRLLIDLTNVPMYYFLNAILPGVNGGKGFTDLFLGSTGMSGIMMAASKDIPQALIGFVFMFLFTISLLVLGVMMLIRLVALTLLLVFSPFGFAAALMPGLQKYGHQWWESFWRYALFGPASALMLLVAIRFQNEIGRDGTFGGLVTVSTNMSAGSPEASAVARIVFYIIPLILIWTAIGMANSSSIAGAGMVTGWGYGAARWAGRKAGGVAFAPVKFAGRKIEKKMAETKGLKWLSPTVLKTAWKARSEEQKHKDEAPVKLAAAEVQDKLNAGISRAVNTIVPRNRGQFFANTNHTNHRFAEQQRQKAEYMKELSAISEESPFLIKEAEAAIAAKNKALLDAVVALLAKNKDLNDLAYAKGNAYGGYRGMSSANIRTILTTMYKQAGMDEREITEALSVNGPISVGAGGYAAGGMTKYDADKHQEVLVANGSEQAGNLVSKFRTLEPQKQAGSLHEDAIFKRIVREKRDASGNVVMKDGKPEEEVVIEDLNDEIGEAFANEISTAMADQSNRARVQMQNSIIEVWRRIKQGEKFEAFERKYDELPAFRDWVNQMMGQRGEVKQKKEQGDDYGMPGINKNTINVKLSTMSAEERANLPPTPAAAAASPTPTPTQPRTPLNRRTVAARNNGT